MFSGLSEPEARLRLARDVANDLPGSRPRSVLREVVAEPMFLLRVACGAIYMLLGDRHEAFMLLGFVFVVMNSPSAQVMRRSTALPCSRGGRWGPAG